MKRLLLSMMLVLSFLAGHTASAATFGSTPQTAAYYLQQWGVFPYGSNPLKGFGNVVLNNNDVGTTSTVYYNKLIHAVTNQQTDPFFQVIQNTPYSEPIYIPAEGIIVQTIKAPVSNRFEAKNLCRGLGGWLLEDHSLKNFNALYRKILVPIMEAYTVDYPLSQIYSFDLTKVPGNSMLYTSVPDGSTFLIIQNPYNPVFSYTGLDNTTYYSGFHITYNGNPPNPQWQQWLNKNPTWVPFSPAGQPAVLTGGSTNPFVDKFNKSPITQYPICAWYSGTW